MSVSAEKQAEYGWPAVPRDFEVLLKNAVPARTVDVKDIREPTTDLAVKVREYAKSHLPGPTFNHSLRVYYYGKVILKQQFPDWRLTDETFYVTCLLHDIGTTNENLHATLLSFEFYGGLLALDLLQGHNAPKPQAESVAECIIRHQDLGKVGEITQLGAVIQLATVFDNVGLNPNLVDKATIESVVAAFPRNKWTSCFVSTLQEEVGLKPWCHTTAIDNFVEHVRGNKLMEPYDA